MPETTSLGCIALLTNDQDSPSVEKSLALLGEWQVESGSVPVSPETPSATWPTAIAVPGWASKGDNLCDDRIRSGTRYLLGNEGKTFVSDPRVYGRDTQLVGWSMSRTFER